MLAFFDSGFGGLSVLEVFIRKFPQFNYLYLGDNARYPYGNRSKENIIKFSREVINFLIQKGATTIFCACNTVSSVALETLKSEFDGKVKLYGVIDPVIKKIKKNTKNKRVGIVGTQATINSGIYKKKIESLDSEIKVYSKACPLIVPLIEESWHKNREAKMILKKYLRSIKSCNVDTLVLGCTHYPFMLKDFQKIMGPKTKIITNGDSLVDFYSNILLQNPKIEKELIENHSQEQSIIYTTDCSEKFQVFAQENLRSKIANAKKAEL